MNKDMEYWLNPGRHNCGQSLAVGGAMNKDMEYLAAASQNRQLPAAESAL